MQRLVNPVQPYAWGSRTLLAEFLGSTSPAPQPQAELWLGAHPSAPSRLVTEDGEQALDDVVSLPFLLKVLAVAGPLSLQVHPDLAAAQEGFAAEESEGVALDSRERLFRDANHKPELICALTPFEALCGLRPVEELDALLAELAVPQFQPVAGRLGEPEGRRALLEAVLGPPDPGALVADVVEACGRPALTAGEFAAAYDGVVELARRFPGDPGVVVSVLLNRVRLDPGQALFIPPGRLHAYLSGLGVEVMACSDNVLRGGLTGKHVDVPQLLAAADFGPDQLTAVAPRPGEDGWEHYDVPVDDFALSRADLKGGTLVSADDGPQILLCVDGQLRLADEAGRADLRRGESVFAPAGARLEVSGTGSLVRAAAGRPRVGPAGSLSTCTAHRQQMNALPESSTP